MKTNGYFQDSNFTLKRSLRLFLLFFIITESSHAVTQAGNGGRVTLQELFQNVRNYQQRIPPYACDIEVNASANVSSDKHDMKSLINFRKDSERVDLITKQYDTLNEKSTLLYEKRTFWDGKQSFVCQQQGTSKKLVSAVVASSKEMYSRILFDQSTGAFLEGKFWHNPDVGDWIDLLQKGESVSLGAKKEQIDGYSCDVVDAHTAYGDYKFWIDPDNGYNIRHAVITVEGNDIAWGKKLGTLLGKESPKSFSRIQMGITDVTIKKIEGYYFPIGGTLTTRLTYSDGSAFIKKQVIKRTNIQWNPDFNAMGAFQIDLPEGSIVTNKDISGIKLEWRGGKLIPYVDDLVVNELNKAAKEIISGKTTMPQITASESNQIHNNTTDANSSQQNDLRSFASESSSVNQKSQMLLVIMSISLLCCAVVIGILLFKKTKQ